MLSWHGAHPIKLIGRTHAWRCHPLFPVWFRERLMIGIHIWGKTINDIDVCVWSYIIIILSHNPHPGIDTRAHTTLAYRGLFSLLLSLYPLLSPPSILSLPIVSAPLSRHLLSLTTLRLPSLCPPPPPPCLPTVSVVWLSLIAASLCVYLRSLFLSPSVYILCPFTVSPSVSLLCHFFVTPSVSLLCLTLLCVSPLSFSSVHSLCLSVSPLPVPSVPLLRVSPLSVPFLCPPCLSAICPFSAPQSVSSMSVTSLRLHLCFSSVCPFLLSPSMFLLYMSLLCVPLSVLPLRVFAVPSQCYHLYVPSVPFSICFSSVCPFPAPLYMSFFCLPILPASPCVSPLSVLGIDTGETLSGGTLNEIQRTGFACFSSLVSHLSHQCASHFFSVLLIVYPFVCLSPILSVSLPVCLSHTHNNALLLGDNYWRRCGCCPFWQKLVTQISFYCDKDVRRHFAVYLCHLLIEGILIRKGFIFFV